MNSRDWFINICVILVLVYESLCVVGLAPTHVAFRDEGGVTGVDFNVGKSDRSAIKVTGKRKKVLFFSSRAFHLLVLLIVQCVIVQSPNCLIGDYQGVNCCVIFWHIVRSCVIPQHYFVEEAD